MPRTCAKTRRYKSLYRYIRTPKGNIPMHVYLFERYHAYEVPKGMIIHHANGNGHDNRPGNLVMMTVTEHLRFHRGWIFKDGILYKPCGTCKQYKKAFTDFYWVRMPGREKLTPQGQCKLCHVIQVREWHRKKRRQEHAEAS